MNREEFLKLLESKNFNLEDPEVVRAVQVLIAFEQQFPVVQCFQAQNMLEINIKLRYPCIYKVYPLKLSDSPVPILLYNTFIFKPV